MDTNNKVSDEQPNNPENVQQEAELNEGKVPTVEPQSNGQQETSTDPPDPVESTDDEKQSGVSSPQEETSPETTVQTEDNHSSPAPTVPAADESQKADTAPETQETVQSYTDASSSTTVSENPEVKLENPTVDDNRSEENTRDSVITPDTEVKETSEEVDILADVDLENSSKEELFELLKKYSHLEQIRILDKGLKELKPHYDTLYSKEKETALTDFIENGGTADDFEYKGDETDRKFFELYDLLKEKRHKFYSQMEKEKDENLIRKNEILEELRELVDNDESTSSIDKLKELQAEWKKIGHVPGQHVKTLWANYNALLDRYYDHRSIYFELKELDRQKNLKGKLELCERAEALDKIDNIKSAITQLNELHEEFKHIGPIPRDDQEPVWQRFKAASDKVYAKRKVFYDEVRKDQEKNLEEKKKLGDQAAEFLKFESDRITEWNKKTKEILELQKQWETVGGLPREHAKEINKHFWGSFKEFFNRKNHFFKKLEGMREDNLKKKQELLDKALSLKESDAWEETAKQLKTLQSQWREIGPVPEKFRNEIYQNFKSACDEFFNRKRGQNQEKNKEFEENLKKKEAICGQLESVISADTINLEEIYDLLDQYAEIGFVPRQSIKTIHGRFDAITNQLISLDELTDEQRNELKTQVQVNKLKGSPHGGQKINRKENAIKRKITTLESDITTWQNNLEFFANSKTADKLKSDFQSKIESAKKEIDALRKQLGVLHQS